MKGFMFSATEIPTVWLHCGVSISFVQENNVTFVQTYHHLPWTVCGPSLHFRRKLSSQIKSALIDKYNLGGEELRKLEESLVIAEKGAGTPSTRSE